MNANAPTRPMITPAAERGGWCSELVLVSSLRVGGGVEDVVFGFGVALPCVVCVCFAALRCVVLCCVVLCSETVYGAVLGLF